MDDVARRDAAERDADDDRRARDDRWRDQRRGRACIHRSRRIDRGAGREAGRTHAKASSDWIADQKKRKEDDARCGDLCSARARVRREAW